MKEREKYAYSGYIIQNNCNLSDDDVISYEFKNAGATDCEINGIFVARKSADFPFNYFKEDTAGNEKNGKFYQIKFINSNPNTNFLIVIEKRRVFN